MSNYKGVIIEESLENKDILKKVKIIKTDVEEVTNDHKTPWLKRWTLHTIEVDEDKAKEVTEEISRSLDNKHAGSWYADYVNDKNHYIIFPNKIFFIDRTNQQEYNEAKNYGITLGIPSHQVDFHPEVKKWER